MCTQCDERIRKAVDEKRPQIERDPRGMRLRNEMLEEFHGNILKAGELTVPTVMRLMNDFAHKVTTTNIGALFRHAQNQMGMLLPGNFFASEATALMTQDILSEAADRVEQGKPLLEVPTESLQNVVGFPRTFKRAEAMVH